MIVLKEEAFGWGEMNVDFLSEFHLAPSLTSLLLRKTRGAEKQGEADLVKYGAET